MISAAVMRTSQQTYEADPTKNGLRHARFPVPLVTPAVGFLCFYGIYYMKGRHRRARFVRIVHYTRLRNFTDGKLDTQNTHNHAHFSSSVRSRGPQRSAQRVRWRRARPRAVNRRAQQCKKPDLCRRRRGCEYVKEGSAGGCLRGLGRLRGLFGPPVMDLDH